MWEENFSKLFLKLTFIYLPKRGRQHLRQNKKQTNKEKQKQRNKTNETTTKNFRSSLVMSPFTYFHISGDAYF